MPFHDMNVTLSDEPYCLERYLDHKYKKEVVQRQKTVLVNKKVHSCRDILLKGNMFNMWREIPEPCKKYITPFGSEIVLVF
jgi:hypothetical protein